MSCQVAVFRFWQRGCLRRRRGGLLHGLFNPFADHITATAQQGAQQQESNVRHAGNHPHAANNHAGQVQHLRLGKQLADQLTADVLIIGHARYHHTGRSRMISDGICATRPSPMASKV